MQTLIAKLFGRVHALEDRLSVRTQITVAAAALALILTAALAIAAADISYRTTIRLMNVSLTQAATSTVAKLDQQIGARKESIELFSQLEPLRRIWQGDPEIVRATLDDLQRSVADFAWIGFARSDGMIAAATGGLLQGVSVANQDWFKSGLSETTVAHVQETHGMSALLGPRRDGEPHRYIDIAVPVRNADQTVIGVIGAHMSWDWAKQLIASAADSDGDGESDTSVSVTTTSGAVLVGLDANAIANNGARLARILQNRLEAISPAIDMGNVLSAFAISKHASHGANLTVTASQPTGIALAAAINSARSILIIGAVCSVVGVLLAFLIGRRIARPIVAITHEADRIGRAPAPVMLNRHNGSVEVIQLSHALRALLRRIGFAEEHTRKVELHARESTSQLRDDLSRMRHLASIDQLTELMNRRAFLEAADDIVAQARRDKSGIAALMIDIDCFKHINDSYGHAAGDAAIRQVAEIVRNNISGADRAARFGGEEFVVLLREADTSTARFVAERVRRAVQKTRINFGEQNTTVTVSIGIAMLTTEDNDVQDIIQRADQGLYLAKIGGRNRTMLMQRGRRNVIGK